MAFKSYTTCVQPGQYKDLDLTPQIVFAVLGLLAGIFTAGIAAIVSILAGLSAL
jgi:hypothetical protein